MPCSLGVAVGETLEVIAGKTDKVVAKQINTERASGIIESSDSPCSSSTTIDESSVEEVVGSSM
jgi:hypothetical protein